MIVTGGARRLGAVIARLLAGRGHRVVVHHHRSSSAATALVDALGAAGGQVVAIEQDLAVAGAAEALIEAARRALGEPVSGLVNSASLFDYDVPPIVDAVALDRHIAVNLAAPTLLASALARQDDLGAGAVVNILDQKVANLNPDFFSYSCSKIALAGATTMLAQALAPRISVNAVSPGLTLPSLDQTQAEFDAVAAVNLLRRRVDPGAIARAVDFLLTAQGITGQNLFVDNGQRFLPRRRDVMFSTRETVHG
ncbi:MAG: short-chain dehydrogenase [Sphingomonas sp. 28-66-16]|nr:MAG: short-chain dehydrogenase [Sphingomonas sp. 28-66-16]